MQKYTNDSNISLAIAIFLATDHYDHNSDVISATALIKPLRQLLLGGRISPSETITDIAHLIPSRLGTAIHNGIETALTGHYAEALDSLGYPQSVIDKWRINPEYVEPGTIPIYTEQRRSKEIDGFTISGQFDLIMDGQLEDIKTTSTFTYQNGSKNEDYILQGSIYRWLAPELIRTDSIKIHYVFTDWSGLRAKRETGYPKARTMTVHLPLKSIHETENWIQNKLAQYAEFVDAEESQIPLCTSEELWRKPSVWKYYKNPAKMDKSTKNFDNRQDAFMRLAEDNNVGSVVEVGGEVVACKYCQAFNACSQKDALIADGSLKIL